MSEPIGFAFHDHAQCITDAMDSIAAQCRDKGLQMTPVRKFVLETLLREHRAMGAYDVLEQLRGAGFGSQPPVAYRALDFLVKHGFVHRIERLNAFVACNHPGERHAPTFLICTDCALVAETPGRRAAEVLRDAAVEIGFSVSRLTIEAEGLCAGCAARAAS